MSRDPNRFLPWLYTIMASILAAGVGALWKMSGDVGDVKSRVETIESRGSPQLQATDDRMSRVEERQKRIADDVKELINELKKHEESTRKP